VRLGLEHVRAVLRSIILVLVALAAPVSVRAEPVLPEPWSTIDMRRSQAQLGAQLADRGGAPCNGFGAIRTRNICWERAEAYGIPFVTLYFPSAADAAKFAAPWGTPALDHRQPRPGSDPSQVWHLRAGQRQVAARLVEIEERAIIVLEEMLPVAQLVPHVRALVGTPRDALIAKLGKRRDGACKNEGAICKAVFPPNENGDATATIEIEGGVARRVDLVVYCAGACGERPLHAFDRAFGARATSTRTLDGATLTYVSYARAPGMVVQLSSKVPDSVNVCFGACPK
jgi:hypothetical protein